MIFRIFMLFMFVFSTITCQQQVVEDSLVTIAFGSCNKQELPQPHWQQLIKLQPDLFIWGGDIIYGDTDDMVLLKEKYQLLQDQEDYKTFSSKIPVIGTWDDHDYGINDSGVEWEKKKESQQLFLDFFGASENDVRRNQEGIYNTYTLANQVGSVKVILLDTRYFRSPLEKDTSGNKRYIPTTDTTTTLLGNKQWNWLADELASSDADFIVVVSSIQFLSRDHGYETWGNFPHEIKKMEQLLKKNKDKKVIILSGDRHISEFSRQEVEGLPYPIIDFTSSGLTHSYKKNENEFNTYRVQDMLVKKSFGMLSFDLKNKKVVMSMYGVNGTKLKELVQEYN
ncbi:alkaline phosphatase family protein [Aquimarina sp. ERC-38]|uniref:alkaline phosphatase D family protein n=1 Tax=Aquimarina sp. ERC-38 TaxID=2949996 RepID=UPI002245C5E5|nr:alkaline phosphatase D family protein [Aquimarina sp. ERC-38]UZO80403.1 alkaline phosphatase family protein [Aquimarina sp. ERC-38]